jgi:hypothetical protein
VGIFSGRLAGHPIIKAVVEDIELAALQNSANRLAELLG